MKTYYLFEKNEDGGHSYKERTIEEIKEYFSPEDENLEYNIAWESVRTAEDLQDFLDNFINDENGVKVHSYYIEEAGEKEEKRLTHYAKGVSEAQKRASNRYDRANTKTVALKLNKKTDADILAKLESVDNVQGYIKALIRADMSDND